MTHKVKITKVYISDKDKDKKPLLTRDGKPYFKIGIKTDKFGEDWYSCLSFRDDDKVRNLQEGDEVIIAIEINGQYKNFKLPTRLDLLEERVDELEVKVGHIVPYPVAKIGKPEITAEDLPF